MQWAIANGWSVPPICRLSVLTSLDLRGVAISGDDFNQKQLQMELNKEANLQRLCVITEQEMEGQTVLFTASVSQAQGACHYLNNNYGIPSVCVWGTMDEDERRENLVAFKSRQAKVLVNCQVVAVGFDYPPTATLILGRPTRSRSFWLQCVGRATRPLPGVVDFDNSTPTERKMAIARSAKPHFKIVDCTDSSLDHRIITSVDMFVDPAVKDEVKKQFAAAKEPLTQEELLELAAKEAQKKAAAEAIEAMRKATTGRGHGTLSQREIDLTFSGKRSVGTYTNPLRGKYAGVKLSELPGHYLRWGADNPTLSNWIRSMYRKEMERRNGRFASR
jgi:superfamily II DNA or RNA helicase